jgi:hypothetical protein
MIDMIGVRSVHDALIIAAMGGLRDAGLDLWCRPGIITTGCAGRAGASMPAIRYLKEIYGPIGSAV